MNQLSLFLCPTVVVLTLGAPRLGFAHAGPEECGPCPPPYKKSILDNSV